MSANIPADERLQQSLTPFERVTCLLAEYDALRAEIRVFIQEQPKQFTVFSAIILGISYFSVTNPQYIALMGTVPFLLLTLAYVTIGQAFMQACIASHIQEIEKEIAAINGGQPVLTWDHKVVPNVMVPLLLRIGIGKKQRLVNPLPVSIALLALAVASISGISGYVGFKSMSQYYPWNFVYLVILFVSHMAALIHVAALSTAPTKIAYAEYGRVRGRRLV